MASEEGPIASYDPIRTQLLLGEAVALIQAIGSASGDDLDLAARRAVGVFRELFRELDR